MATLTVTITEELVLNGVDRGASNVVTATVNEVDHRILKASTTEQTILEFDSSVAAGTFVDGTLDYLRITNLDSTNFVTLRVLGSSEEYFVKIEAGDSFILNNSVMDANATGSQAVALANIDTIKAEADTAACNLEIFAAA